MEAHVLNAVYYNLRRRGQQRRRQFNVYAQQRAAHAHASQKRLRDAAHARQTEEQKRIRRARGRVRARKDVDDDDDDEDDTYYQRCVTDWRDYAQLPFPREKLHIIAYAVRAVQLTDDAEAMRAALRTSREDRERAKRWMRTLARAYVLFRNAERGTPGRLPACARVFVWIVLARLRYHQSDEQSRAQALPHPVAACLQPDETTVMRCSMLSLSFAACTLNSIVRKVCVQHVHSVTRAAHALLLSAARFAVHTAGDAPGGPRWFNAGVYCDGHGAGTRASLSFLSDFERMEAAWTQLLRPRAGAAVRPLARAAMPPARAVQRVWLWLGMFVQATRTVAESAPNEFIAALYGAMLHPCDRERGAVNAKNFRVETSMTVLQRCQPDTLDALGDWLNAHEQPAVAILSRRWKYLLMQHARRGALEPAECARAAAGGAAVGEIAALRDLLDAATASSSSSHQDEQRAMRGDPLALMHRCARLEHVLRESGVLRDDTPDDADDDGMFDFSSAATTDGGARCSVRVGVLYDLPCVPGSAEYSEPDARESALAKLIAEAPPASARTPVHAADRMEQIATLTLVRHVLNTLYDDTLADMVIIDDAAVALRYLNARPSSYEYELPVLAQMLNEYEVIWRGHVLAAPSAQDAEQGAARNSFAEALLIWLRVLCRHAGGALSSLPAGGGDLNELHNFLWHGHMPERI